MGALKALVVGGTATVTATTMIMFSVMGGDGATNVALAENDCGKPAGGGSSTPTQTYGPNDPSGEATVDIPADYLDAYRAAGEEYGLDWTYIAAIGKIETDHGRYGADGGGCISGPETAYGAAQGPLQFIPSTWDMIGGDGDGDGTADPCNYRDAIPAAANYLKQSGAPGDWYGAIYAYNHADWYVQDVMAQADTYRSAAAKPGGGGPQAAVDGVGEAAEMAFAALPPAHLASVADALRSEASVLGTRSAAAETLDWNLVGGDKTLTYADYTAYDSALSHGVGAWNSVGIISVEPAGGGGADVEVGDTTTQESILGRTSTDGTLVFNVPQMDGATQNAQNATASHELGHAVGLAHTSNPSVMNTPIFGNMSNNYEDPTDFDVQELSGLWGAPSSDGGGSEGPQSPDDPSGGGDDFYGGIFDDDGSGVGGNGGSGGGSSEPPNNFDSTGGGDDDDIQINRKVQRNGESSGGGDGGGGAGGSSPEEANEPTERDGFPFNIFGGDDDGGNGGGNGGDGSGDSGSDDQQYDGGPSGGQYDGGGTGGGSEPISCPDPGPGEGGSDLPDGGNGGDGGGSGDGNAVVAEAEKYLGVPYVLGGPAECIPGEIMDCTCLTTTAYRPFGYELTDSPGGQMGYGEPVEGELQPGDITFYAEHGDGIISHVAISMGGNKIVHASAYLGEVGYTEDHSYLDGYVGARRLLN